ncbi:MAG: hypothetical protein H7288_19300 [Kineosporiaceae bacterium]|nr:hypothetical protein [Aeromicrobium sp.]
MTNRSVISFVLLFIGTFAASTALSFILRGGLSIAALSAWTIGGVVALTAFVVIPPGKLRHNPDRLRGNPRSYAISAFAGGVALALIGIAFLLGHAGLLLPVVLALAGLVIAALSLATIEGRLPRKRSSGPGHTGSGIGSDDDSGS